MDWPARSPDLSWIENLWAYVKKRLSQRTDLTKDNFLDVVNHEWDNMDENSTTFKRLY
jgi:transposase